MGVGDAPRQGRGGVDQLSVRRQQRDSATHIDSSRHRLAQGEYRAFVECSPGRRPAAAAILAPAEASSVHPRGQYLSPPPPQREADARASRASRLAELLDARRLGAASTPTEGGGGGCGSSAGAVSFAERVLGVADVRRAPKADRDAVIAFVAAVQELVGGDEADPAEVAEAVPVAWACLTSGIGPPDARQARLVGGSAGRIAAVESHAAALSSVLGFPVEVSEAVADAVDAASLLVASRGAGRDGDVGGDALASTSGGASPSPDAGWGASLGVYPPRLPDGSRHDLEAFVRWCDRDVAEPVPMGFDAWGMLDELLATGLRPPAPPPLPTIDPTPVGGFLGGYAPGCDGSGSDDTDLAAAPARERATIAWLQQWVTTTAARSQADVELLELLVLKHLLSGTPPEELVSELVDVLGFDALDAVGEVARRSGHLSDRVRRLVREAREEEADSLGGEQAGMPTVGRQVTVTTQAAKNREKALRKERRRGRGAATDGDIGWLQREGLDKLVEREQAEIQKAKSLSGTNGFGGASGSGTSPFRALPAGTVREAHKGWEQIRVPAPATGVLGEDERLVPISELVPWAQTAFAGVERLNRIQSRIFPVAYHSNENLLVCAPTGAGKTNIAMLTVLHEVSVNMRAGVIQREDFKVVYVAPMKALAGEVTAAFNRRLAGLGLKVRELTGDMSLTKKEMAETNMIVTTPEKWDVITRKGQEGSAAALVRLLIIDEVHLLNDGRGPVIETLVARTIRQVESAQRMIRIVGLSATLPNYRDVATFLRVNHTKGLFFFDASYRPVPLSMTFVGVSEQSTMARLKLMNQIAFDKVSASLKAGYQAMVFVHSRKDTGKTARAIIDLAHAAGEEDLLRPTEDEQYGLLKREVLRSRNREVQELFDRGVLMHHAGMLRGDRNLVEKLFERGVVRVLCCTATLAWGVNLPAHTVVIKGTRVYSAEAGGFTEVGLLDVQQIFGRAGRPQYGVPGHGIIITEHANLARYLGMLTHSVPIESKFESQLVDNLNAEVVLGTVANVREACTWLSYTYMHARACKNPLAYGLTWEQLQHDPALEGYRRKIVVAAARALEASKMCRFDERTGNLYITDLGRVAAHFYIKHKTIVEFNDRLRPRMSEAAVFALIASSSEFENLAVRDDETIELETLARRQCLVEVRGDLTSKEGKVNVLLQSFISRARIDTFSLVADLNYVAQNAPRISRGLLEIVLRRGWPAMTETMINVCKAIDRTTWPQQHPFRQFSQSISPALVNKLEEAGLYLDRLVDLDASGDIGAIDRIARHPRAGHAVRDALRAFPRVAIDCEIQPITRTVLRVSLNLTPEFEWRERDHGSSLRWLVWVEDSENDHIYHSEMWVLTRRSAYTGSHRISFTIPIFEPLPSQYYVRVVSDSWLHSEAFHEMRFDHLVLPELAPAHTPLLDLDPLPRSALNDPVAESLYKFSHFNPLQTQAFHTLYHTDSPVLLGAPTGSGKTIMAELALLRCFRNRPGAKVVYVAPLKALVRERILDWGQGLCHTMGKTLVELTGDVTPDARALLQADVIVCTPEKWDGISRSWQSRSYVRRVGVVVLDEVHLLGSDRGPVLEVLVSRMRYVASRTGAPVRFVALSTALSNAGDLGDWLGVPPEGLFNFQPSVRPVPMEVHIQGYPGANYCPRMATMNKPTYAAIQLHSPLKPTIVFVSSRRQTRLTALDLIASAIADEKTRAFIRCDADELDTAAAGCRDPSLRHTLGFGVGLHHAGLPEADRRIVEALFVQGKILVLVATSTLAWGVNTPAHLVVVKGTEFYDASTRQYVDYPITDVLQMMGRAGRPQFDKYGVAVVMVAEGKKSFYKKFLYEPFPVESSLAGQLADHLGAEIAGGTVRSAQDAVDWLTWTFLFRRMLKNPAYYDMPSTDAADVSTRLSALVSQSLGALEEAGCVRLDESSGVVECLPAGRTASMYYLRHETMGIFRDRLGPDLGIGDVLASLTAAREFDDVPVRHNEDLINVDLNRAPGVVDRFPVRQSDCDQPNAKAQLLLQMHVSRVPPPVADYATDLRGVLDNAARVLAAMIEVVAEAGWLRTTLVCLRFGQAMIQARWDTESPLRQLPGVSADDAAALEDWLGDGDDAAGGAGLPRLVAMARDQPEAAESHLRAVLGDRGARAALSVARRLPLVRAEAAGPPRPADGVGGHLNLDLRLIRRGGGPATPRAYAPLSPKARSEGWWVVAAAEDELLAMRRVGGIGLGGAQVQLRIPARVEGGAPLRRFVVHVVSDCYQGLDATLDVDVPESVVVAAGEGTRDADGVVGSEMEGGGGWSAVDTGRKEDRHSARAVAAEAAKMTGGAQVQLESGVEFPMLVPVVAPPLSASAPADGGWEEDGGYVNAKGGGEERHDGDDDVWG